MRSLLRSVVVMWLALACLALAQQPAPARLTLMVAMTPQELATFRPALEALDAAHPEFEVELEPVPQGALPERANARLAAGTLPDVVRVEGLSAQQWIRRGAFLELTAGGAFGGLWRVGDAHDFARVAATVLARPREPLARAVAAHYEAHLSAEAIGRQARAAYEAVLAARGGGA